MSDGREARLAFDSTRWKNLSSTLDFPLSSVESSQSEESSSSMALSSTYSASVSESTADSLCCRLCCKAWAVRLLMWVFGRAELTELLRESSPEEPPIWNMGFLPTAAEGALMFSILWLCSLDEQDPPRANRAGCFLGCTCLGAGEELGSGKGSCDEAAAAGSGNGSA